MIPGISEIFIQDFSFMNRMDNHGIVLYKYLPFFFFNILIILTMTITIKSQREHGNT